MPAPTKESIKEKLRLALINGTNPLESRVEGQRQAFLKVDETGSTPVTIPGVLPNTIDDLIDAMAEGIHNQWVEWQAAQQLQGFANGVTPGGGAAPIQGTLP